MSNTAITLLFFLCFCGIAKAEDRLEWKGICGTEANEAAQCSKAVLKRMHTDVEMEFALSAAQQEQVSRISDATRKTAEIVLKDEKPHQHVEERSEWCKQSKN